MVRLNCFRAAKPTGLQHDLDEEAPRPKNSPSQPRSIPHPPNSKRGKHFIRRHGSSDSQASSWSNESISKLPPCSRVSDPKIEAMMMPVPAEGRPSRCLRLSQPRTYGAIVDSMKNEKGCRDWRNFAVFHSDEVDDTLSAVEIAERRATEYERKLRQLNSFSTNESIGLEFIP